MVHHLDDMDSKIQGFLDLVAREGENDSDWTSHNNRLFERPLYKRARRDMGSERPAATEAIQPSEERKPHSKAPLTSSLGEALKISMQK